jgi:quinol monooxygenase YgiN
MQNSISNPRRNMLSSSLATAGVILTSTQVMGQSLSPNTQVNSRSSVNVIITFETKPDAVAAFAALLEQVKKDLPKVKGCKGVRAFFGKDNPRIFTLVEEWETEQSHKTHIDQVIASGAWEKNIAIHLAKPPVSYYYSELIA